VKNSHIEEGAQVGPFAHVREHTHIGKHARISNFVEIKKSVVSAGAHVLPLTYMQDEQMEPSFYAEPPANIPENNY
jgi:bifunctional UDP-N-acetylglucosamine pyrophosphorylase/glucosamine-1-phosphate N-acetyltransferase